MTNPVPLSPAAQAVLDAQEEALSLFDNYGHDYLARGLIAALRAAVQHSEMLYDPHGGLVSVVRADLLHAIAAELDPTTGTSGGD